MDILIIGAGPAGAGTALKLSYLGIPCTVVDKATFPRDKICGDAVSGKVTTLLNRLDPAILHRFTAIADGQVDVWGIKFVAPNMREIDIPFKSNFDRAAEPAPGYVSRRTVFDNFLVDEMKRRDNITLLEGVEIKDIERSERGYRVVSKDGQFVADTRLLVVANGAHSQFARHRAGIKMEPAHHAGAVRAYYQGVENLHADNFIELHFVKDVTPGYFWIFPLPNGSTNIGLGMRSDFVSKQKINLRKEMERIIAEHPTISPRFKNATREGKIRGYGLPLGSKNRSISGDHYMLVGDAASLIDPLTGEGIGNGFYSGFIAAEQARDCLATHDFSAATLKAFDKRVARVLGAEMKLSYRMQQLLRYPVLANTVANIIGRNMGILDTFSRMYNDFELRKQIVNPVFWWRQWRGAKG